MKKHANIPVFIPHLGCPNQCVFCNQRVISGVRTFDVNSVKQIIDTALETIDKDTSCEIAFFGGSFTGIDRSLMIELLKIANSYVLSGRVSGIRCSTRPDYISEDILADLKKYGVKVIELGLQSADNRVLELTKRGHNFIAEKEACKLIKDNGFALVGQMMIGLPGSTEKSEEDTAEFIISTGADAARIYPTVVFKDTELCNMVTEGDYTPLTNEEAVKRTARVMRKFIEAGVDVIRVGLCSSENLVNDETYFSGPNHPAIGELVENEIFYELIKEKIKTAAFDKCKTITVLVPKGAISKAIGQSKKNKLRLISEYSLTNIKFIENDLLTEYDVSIVKEG